MAFILPLISLVVDFTVCSSLLKKCKKSVSFYTADESMLWLFQTLYNIIDLLGAVWLCDMFNCYFVTLKVIHLFLIHKVIKFIDCCFSLLQWEGNSLIILFTWLHLTYYSQLCLTVLVLAVTTVHNFISSELGNLISCLCS